MAETHPKRLTLSIPPPLEDGDCDAGCPLYYAVAMEGGRDEHGTAMHTSINGCSADLGEYRDICGIRVLCPGPRCPWGKKEAGE